MRGELWARCDGALWDAAAQAAAVISRAMGYRAGPPPLPEETDYAGDGKERDWSNALDKRTQPTDPLEPATTANQHGCPDETDSRIAAEELARRREIDWLGDDSFGSNSEPAVTDGESEPLYRRDIDWL